MAPVSSPEIAPVTEGEILDGKYRVERVLGAGGMGVVVAATHVQLNTRVALKFLLPAAVGNPQIVERFAREARAAVQIQSEHVARVTDVGTLPTGSPYMVMEYLEGGDLAQTLEKGGPVPVPQAIGYLLQACEAIAEAHALGIVHRDLKPANLFLARRTGRDSIVKVLDFGISKTNDSGRSGLTQASTMMGSPQYMAPEQMMSSKDVDVRADIWALGVILYELLTGAPPFAAETMAEIVYMVTQRDAAPLLSKRPDAPPALGEVIARALARDPAQRYPNVAKLATAIAPFGPPRSEISIERISRVLGATDPPPPARGRPGSPPPMQATASTWTQSYSVSSSGPKTRILLAAALTVLLVAVVSWRFLRGGPEIPSARPVTAAMTPPTPAPSPEAPPVASVIALSPLPSSKPIVASAPSEAPAPSATVSVAPHPTAPLVSKLHAALPSPGPSAPPASGPPSPTPMNRGLNMGMKE